MCEVSKTVKDVVDKLRNNPVFRMSLASKELFHSNMLAWFLESSDSEDPLLSDIAKELAKLFMPDYTVLTVLRERKHFDLLIVLLPTKDCNDSIKNSLTEISNFFQNSEQISEDLLKTLNGCKFAVVENKFKSIPNDRQLNEYKQKAKITFKTKESKIKIEMKDENENKNTTYYLLAPKVSLDSFKEKCSGWETISWNTISDTLSKALEKTKEKSDFTGEFIEYYADFLENMLKLTTDIEEKLKLPNNLAFPKREDIRELSKIRIHDFYEKLWFSVLLSKINTVENVEKGIWYSNSSGLVQFQITKDNVVYGVQIQQGQFRFFVVPDDKYKWKDNPCPIDKIKDYLDDVLRIMNKQFLSPFKYAELRATKEMCKYGDFKYKYIKKEQLEIDKKSVAELETMVKCALNAINNSDKKTLEAEKK